MFIFFKFLFGAALIFHSFDAAANQLQDAKKLPSGLLVPPSVDRYDPFYVRWEIIRNKLFFLDYYGLRELNAKKEKGEEQTVFLQNPQLIDTLNDITLKALKGDQKSEERVAAYENYFDSVCLDCIFEELTKNAEYPDAGTRISPECDGILKSKAFLSGNDRIFYKDGPRTYIFWTDYEGTASFPKVSVLRAHSDAAVVPLISMPFFWIGKVRFFEHYGRLYYVDSDHENTNFAVFEFNTEAGIFKDACRFTSNVTATGISEKGKDNPVCQAVADKKYQSHESAPLASVMPAEEFKSFKTAACLRMKAKYENNGKKFSLDDCLNSKAPVYHELASETTGKGTGLKIDYNNDGKDEILMDAFYASGSGSGCGHALFRIYDSPDDPTRLITNGERDGVYFHGGNTGDGYEISCNNGNQKIVTVEGKNYLLTMGKAGPERLDLISTRADGKNKIEQICSFSPETGYQ